MTSMKQAARAFVAAAMLLTIAGWSPIAGDAAGPKLRLRPNDGPAGITTLARGRGFAPGASGVLIWSGNASTLGVFAADDDGRFEVEIAIPAAEPGVYQVIARAADDEAADDFEVTPAEVDGGSTAPSTPPPFAATPLAGSTAGQDVCVAGLRRIDVSDAAGLNAALAAALPGDVIHLADGVYPGLFIAAASGTADAPIALCGTRAAAIDGGDWGNGYALHITGDHWIVHGITVRNALKGVMLDDADFTLLDGIEVHTIGHEAVHFRTHSADNVIQHSDIHDTGLKRDKFGEGVYLGSAISNWGKYPGGEADRSDRNQVMFNRIWKTTSEAIDVKEGTTGGLIQGNQFDGSGLTGADSWVDVKGNGYLIQDNTGINSPVDGFQTHVINNLDWGRDNVFANNIAEVNGAGFGFSIHDAATSNNHVQCDNLVSDAAKGFGNVACG